MKKILHSALPLSSAKYWIFAAVLTICGMSVFTACSSNDDNTVIPSRQEMEASLIGLWYDEFDYEDVTEEGLPFTKVLLAVQVDDDHTGCLYLGAFNDTDYYPLVVYGGKEDAGFKWALLDDGSVLLSDPKTGESAVLARAATRGEGDGSYGSNMTNVANTNVTYTNKSMVVTNASYTGTLEKANTAQTADINDKLQPRITSVNSGDTGIGYTSHGDGPDRARAREK